MGDLYCIACTIEHGAFARERVFGIQLSEKIRTHDGTTVGNLVGTAHPDHLRDRHKQRLQEDEPGAGNSVEGFVLCRKLREMDEGWVIVEVPSADALYVSEDALVVTPGA